MKLNGPNTWYRRLQINLAITWYFCFSRVFLLWYWFCSPPKGQIWVADKVEEVIPDTWNDWLDRHFSVCNQCRQAFRLDTDIRMCNMAFEKSKEYSINHK